MQQLLIVHGTKYILTNKEITVEPLLENIGKIAPTTRFHQAEKRIRVGGKSEENISDEKPFKCIEKMKCERNCAIIFGAKTCTKPHVSACEI